MKIALLLSLMLSGFLSFAEPMDCQSRNGIPIQVKTVSPSQEVFTLCRFGFSSYVDSNSLRWPTSAVQAYKALGPDSFGANCVFSAATLVEARDVSGYPYQLCRFFDRSYMERQTFSNGPGSPFNREMDWALGLF